VSVGGKNYINNFNIKSVTRHTIIINEQMPLIFFLGGGGLGGWMVIFFLMYKVFELIKQRTYIRMIGNFL
jgi:hypothetical protein